MNEENNNAKPKTGGVTNKGVLYSHASKYGIEVIDFLVETMRNEHVQRSVRVSAANKLLDKTLADLNANDITTGDKPLILIDSRPDGNYIHQISDAPAPSAGSMVSISQTSN